MEEIAQEVEATEIEASPEPVPEMEPDYDLHIKIPANMRLTLRDCAELAYKMGDIPKPNMVNLMNLFITWGMSIQKKKWLDRAGYR